MSPSKKNGEDKKKLQIICIEKVANLLLSDTFENSSDFFEISEPLQFVLGRHPLFSMSVGAMKKERQDLLNDKILQNN